MLISHRNGHRSRRGVVIATLLACALAFAIPDLARAGTAEHIDLPDGMPGDRLLVMHRTATSTELHTVDLHADDRTVLTTGHADFEGAWSPDGRHVGFHRVEVGGSGLWVVPREGGDPRRLAEGGHSPVWSPDATRILHSPSTEADPVPLAVTDLTGATTEIPGSAGGIEPAWSPDGTLVAYVDATRDFALAISHVDGADRTVTPGPASEPTWSPSSDRVAYIDRQGDLPRLMLIDGAASESSVLTDRFGRIQQPAFSPAGTHLAFAAAETDDDQVELWTIRIDDGELVQLTDGSGEDFGPSWSASGEWIAFTRTQDLSAGDSPRDVMLIPSAGGPARQVTETGVDYTLAFAPGRSMRLAGHDRISTAITLSQTIETAATAVVVRADGHPDALAAAPLAATVEGPVLLTGTDGLDPSVAAELSRLGTSTVYLLGGHAALSPRVEADLRTAGITSVTRLAGSDRFGTAAQVLDELDVLHGGIERIFIAEGEHADPARGWPDALSAAGAAAHTLDPILLVTYDRVPAETASALREHSEVRATIVGGTAAVSEMVEQDIEEIAPAVERMSGGDRYGTSARAADLAVAADASAAHPWLVTGHNWPDALSAAPAAALDGGVLVLVDGLDPTGSAATHAWLPGQGIDRGVVVGGTLAITTQVLAAIESSLASGP